MKKISIIIVSYNVREFLIHALESINKALRNIAHEIIVVDNASVDGSVQAVSKHFPDIKLIANEENIGFSAANNIGIKKADGDYVVLINPDTLVQEDTFLNLLNFMETTPEAGGATCKILNPDGSFSIDSRHSVPKPSTALWKFLGLSKLFPNNKIFGRYNLTFLDPDETYPVDAISGSFMFLRKKAIEDTGLLDEDYFMYCEDIDYCYRLNEKGWKVYYVPSTSIIHYKGESTKKTNVDYVVNFNKSLYLFYKKHFHKRSFFAFSWLIIFGAIVRAFLIYLKNIVIDYFPNIIDLVILNVTLFMVFYFRFEYKTQFLLSDFFNQYIIINILTSVIFIGTSYFFNLYQKFKISFSRTIKTIFFTFFIIAAITFFLRDFAFSRLVVLIAAVISPPLMILWRLLSIKYFKKFQHHIFSKNTLIVGTDKEAIQIIKKIKNEIESQYNIIGFASINKSDVGNTIDDFTVVASFNNLGEFCRLENIKQIIFSTHNISYEKILFTMSQLNDLNIDFKIIPENMDIVIGKSSVERFSEYPLIEMDYAYGKTFNKLTKRIFDSIISSIILILLSPLALLTYLFSFKKIKQISILGYNNKEIQLRQNVKKKFKGFLNFYFLNNQIFLGRLSFVGAPINTKADSSESFFYKPGIFGLVQLNAYKKLSKEESKKIDVYYLKNQSFWFDLEIIFRSLFTK